LIPQKKTEFHFKMIPISSTDVGFNLDNRTVFVICRENAQLEFEVVDYFKEPTHNCRSPYVPRTEIDFINTAESIKRYIFKTKDNYDESIRFWTDYIRINETHFWSEIASTWWSQCRRSYLMSPNYSRFMSTVTIDGYSELRNMITAHAGCICVGKVISTHVEKVIANWNDTTIKVKRKLKWWFLVSMIALIISFIFCIMSIVWKNQPSAENLQEVPIGVSNEIAETVL